MFVEKGYEMSEPKVKRGDTFRIGQICPESGVYRIKGEEDCKCVSEEQREIPLVKGKRFPPCKNCTRDTIVWEYVRRA